MKCCRIDCEEDAEIAVKLVVPDSLSDETSAEGLLGIELCAMHFREAEDWEFRDAAAFLIALARPGTEPDVAEAYVEAVPVGSMEHKAYLSLRPN